MAKIVVMGAGVAGHTAALMLRRKLGKPHEVTVVAPNSRYQWIPSNIWVGIGKMSPAQVSFELAPVYRKMGITFIQARATAIYPEGGAGRSQPYITAECTSGADQGKSIEVAYDYLVNATGPRLNFEATPGLGPEGFTHSVCTSGHAVEAHHALREALARMRSGEHLKFLIGTGHPTATCQGAAFEYALNVAFEINKHQLARQAEIIWITNEYELGDFGMGGAFIKKGGYVTSTRVFTESILSEYGIRWIKRAGITRVEKGKAYYETLSGEQGEQAFDFAMLIPAFAGAGLRAFDGQGGDITSRLFAPSGFMKVDADYTPRPFEDWSVNDWPSVYRNPDFDNLYAAGIAFAPPHAKIGRAHV